MPDQPLVWRGNIYSKTVQPGQNDYDFCIDSCAPAERVGGFEQLAGLGLSAGQIARRTAARRVEVETALVVTGVGPGQGCHRPVRLSDFGPVGCPGWVEDDTETVTALVAAASAGVLGLGDRHNRLTSARRTQVAKTLGEEQKDGSGFSRSFQIPASTVTDMDASIKQDRKIERFRSRCSTPWRRSGVDRWCSPAQQWNVADATRSAAHWATTDDLINVIEQNRLNR